MSININASMIGGACVTSLLSQAAPLRTTETAKNKGRSPQWFNCHVRVCVRNIRTLKERLFEVCVSHMTPPTSELNLSWQTPQELGFLFKGEVRPRFGPIRALWTWSICNKGGGAQSYVYDWFRVVKDKIGRANNFLSQSRYLRLEVSVWGSSTDTQQSFTRDMM